jgi:DNA-binding MarR family transcriptional regulator
VSIVEEQGLKVSDSDNAADMTDLLAELACTHDALRRAARQLGNLYDEIVSPTGLKITQLVMLGQIESLQQGAGPTLQALAKQLPIGISALTHALRPLVRDGIVQLQADAEDKRIKHALLTPLGKEKLQEGVKLWRVANCRTEAVLGANSALLLRDLAGQVGSDDFLKAYKSGFNAEKP